MKGNFSVLPLTNRGVFTSNFVELLDESIAEDEFQNLFSERNSHDELPKESARKLFLAGIKEALQSFVWKPKKHWAAKLGF